MKGVLQSFSVVWCTVSSFNIPELNDALREGIRIVYTKLLEHCVFL